MLSWESLPPVGEHREQTSSPGALGDGTVAGFRSPSAVVEALKACKVALEILRILEERTEGGTIDSAVNEVRRHRLLAALLPLSGSAEPLNKAAVSKSVGSIESRGTGIIVFPG